MRACRRDRTGPADVVAVPSPQGGLMYPTLQTDPAKAAWIKNTVADLAAFGEEHRSELDTANRANRFPSELYRELGRRGYLGPLVPAEFGGLGGGVAEYVVISEEVGRHGLVSGQIAAQGQRWLLDWGTDEQKDRWLRGIATGEVVFLRVHQREERRVVVQGDEVSRGARGRRLAA